MREHRIVRVHHQRNELTLPLTYFIIESRDTCASWPWAIRWWWYLLEAMGPGWLRDYGPGSPYESIDSARVRVAWLESGASERVNEVVS